MQRKRIINEFKLLFNQTLGVPKTPKNFEIDRNKQHSSPHVTYQSNDTNSEIK